MSSSSRLFVIAQALLVAVAVPAGGADLYWDINGTTLYGDGSQSWAESNTLTNSAYWSTSSSGTVATTNFPDSGDPQKNKSVQFGFGTLADGNTTNGGTVRVGNSSSLSNRPAVGAMIFNASGTSGYTFWQNVGNANVVNIELYATATSGIAAGTGIQVNSNVTGDVTFTKYNYGTGGTGNNAANVGTLGIALFGSQTWRNDSTTYALVMDGPVSGTHALTTAGPGVISLGVANTFGGGLTIASGTLRARHADALSTGAVTVNAGGTLDVRAAISKTIAGTGLVAVGPGGNLSAGSIGGNALLIAGEVGNGATCTVPVSGTLTASSLAMAGNATIAMATTGGIASTGSVTLSGLDNVLSLSGIAAVGRTYTLLQGSSLTNSGSVSLTGAAVGGQTILLGNSATVGRTTYSFSSTPLALQLAVTGSQYTLRWTGAVDNVWDYSTNNWTTGSQSTNFAGGDNGIIDTAAAITIRPEGISADTVTVSHAAGTASLAGGSLTASSLVKSNAGSLSVGSGVTATGVQLNGGSIVVVDGGSITASTIANNASLVYATTGTQTLATAISGTGSIASTAGGTLALTGSSSFSGSLSTDATSTLQIAGGGIAASTITNEGSLYLSGGSASTVAGVVSGGGTVTKSGAGTATLAGANSYTGATTITAGTLKLGSATALGSTDAGTTVSAGGALDLNGQTVAGESLAVAGTGVSNTGGLINSNTSAAATWSGPVTLSSAQTYVGGAGRTTLAGSVGGLGLYKVGEGTVTLAGANSYSGTLFISTGTVQVMDQAALPATALSWNNSNSSAGLDLVAAGDYAMSSIAQFGSYLRVGTTGTGNVVLTVNGNSTLGGTANKSLQVNPRAKVVFAGDITADPSATTNRSATFYNSGEIELNGVISGGATGTIGQFGVVQTANAAGQSGTISLNAANFYTGVTRVSAGTLKVGNALAFGDIANGVTISAVTVTDTTTGITTTLGRGTVDLNGYSIADETLTMIGTGDRVSLVNSSAVSPVSWSGSVSLSGTTALGGPGDITLTGAVSGTAGVLAKSGAGRVTLTAGNSYSGAVSVEQGTLALGAAGSIASATSVTTAAGASFDVTALPGGYTVPSTQTVGGSGTVTGNATVGSGATLSPGATLGTLTVSGSLTWNTGGNYNWQMLSGTGTAGATTSWDVVSVAGPLTIAATQADPFKINLWTLSGISPDVSGSAANFNASSNYTWKIASATGGITGFASNKFLITTSATNGTGGFANAFGSGTFSLAQSGNDLNLVFTAGAPTVITINVATGTQTQTQAGYPTLSGSTPVVKTGAGTLVLTAANTLTGSTTVQGGRLQLADGAALGSSKVVPLAGGTLSLSPYLQTTIGGLAANAGGLTDVGSGMVTVAAGLPAADMVSAIVTGMGDGSWNGTSGITSSVAATSGGDRTVGWLDNGDGSVTFAFAAAGDTNLDWQVDIIDAANFLAGGKFDTGSPASWNEGDFTYDGVV
ncbi:MAG: autotransporter-associated beta strand repeat-containing protein, partial [Planctomycetes bacterium]|nr:autotransporter-associated beta strand repeat-containing protein [Planctomycetota bacterium]